MLKTQAAWIQKNGHIRKPIPFLPEPQDSDIDDEPVDDDDTPQDFQDISSAEYFEQDFSSFSSFVSLHSRYS